MAPQRDHYFHLFCWDSSAHIFDCTFHNCPLYRKETKEVVHIIVIISERFSFSSSHLRKRENQHRQPSKERLLSFSFALRTFFKPSNTSGSQIPSLPNEAAGINGVWGPIHLRLSNVTLSLVSLIQEEVLCMKRLVFCQLEWPVETAQRCLAIVLASGSSDRQFSFLLHVDHAF